MKRPEKPIVSKLTAGETVPDLKSPLSSWQQIGTRNLAPSRSGSVTKAALTTFVDLGLSADEIARYFKISKRTVTTLLDIWDVDGPS